MRDSLKPRHLLCWLAWLYAGLLVAWWVLHTWTGDHLWWLALMSFFAPYLFLPLLPLALLGMIVRVSWRYWVALLVGGLLFFGEYGMFFVPRPVVHAADGIPFTVMTFNLWGSSQSATAVAEVVAHEQPDLILLQELTPSMAEGMGAALAVDYPYQLTDFSQPEREALGIFSRYPLTDVTATVSPALSEFVLVAEVAMPGRAMTVYNVRTDSTNLFAYYEDGLAIPEQVRHSFARREQEMRDLVTDVSRRQTPVIVAGDFNMTDQTMAYVVLTRTLKDAHREAGWGLGHSFPAYQGCYRGLLPIFPRIMRIDMVFHSPELGALASHVSPFYAESDHRPIVVTLQ